MVVEVLDKDMIGKSMCGVGRFKISKLERNEQTAIEVKLTHTDKKGKKTPAGTVTLNVKFVTPRNLGKLALKPQRAELLKDKDWIGKMDPYCKITIGKQKV